MEIVPFSDRILPAPKVGAFRDPDYWIWCGSAIRGEDGRYHLFASRWPKRLSFLNWATNSEVVRAVADRPEGPYRFEEVVLGPTNPERWDGRIAHNPTIRFHEGKFILVYTGSTYRGPSPDGTGNWLTEQWTEAWEGKRPGMAVSDSVFGPWKRRERPLLETRPGKWDAIITSNPAIAIAGDGSALLIYKSTETRHPLGQFPGRFRLGAARATHWTADFERIGDTPITFGGSLDHHIEDPFIWWNGSRYEMVVKDMAGEICGEAQAGIHAVSEDGFAWALGPRAKAYSRTIAWDDGSSTTLAKLERPQILLEDGEPTHLFAATLEKDDAGTVVDSWNMVIPLRRGLGSI